MLTEKIELVEFPSIAFFAECLADFKAEAYNDMYATKPPDNPYFYLIASSQDSVAHYKRYANVVLQDAVNKGCDPKLIKTHLVVRPCEERKCRKGRPDDGRTAWQLCKGWVNMQ